ncbi:hypothetical protein Tco_1401948 [Tanacetum coccineum]
MSVSYVHPGTYPDNGQIRYTLRSEDPRSTEEDETEIKIVDYPMDEGDDGDDDDGDSSRDDARDEDEDEEDEEDEEEEEHLAPADSTIVRLLKSLFSH